RTSGSGGWSSGRAVRTVRREEIGHDALPLGRGADGAPAGARAAPHPAGAGALPHRGPRVPGVAPPDGGPAGRGPQAPGGAGVTGVRRDPVTPSIDSSATSRENGGR